MCFLLCLDRDPLGQRFLRFLQLDVQHAVLVLGPYVVRVDSHGQRYFATEAAEAALLVPGITPYRPEAKPVEAIVELARA